MSHFKFTCQRSTKSALLAGVCLILWTPAASALAQNASGPAGAATAAADNTVVPEVVVTAQRREERLQDVPIAVTALSGQSLQKQGISTTLDLATTVSGLSFNTQLGTLGQPRIRGVGTAASGPGLENPVAVYIDGVYYGMQTGALLDLSDVSQVAVLKGPQGTLFGRNATGGLIQVTTREPTHTLSGDLAATIGTFKTIGLDGYVSGALTDKLTDGLTVHLDNQYEGYGKNFATGDWVQDHRSYAVRDKLRFEPDANTKITLAGAYSKYISANTAMNKVDNIHPPTVTGTAWDVDLNTQPRTIVDLYTASLTVQHDFPGVRVTSTSAYINSLFRSTIDADQLPLNNVVIDFTSREESISQELQFTSMGTGPLTWVGGLFFYSDQSGYLPLVTALPPTRSLITLNSHSGVRSYAAYGQATYKINPTTNITAGLRYTIDDRTFRAGQTFATPAFSSLSSTTGAHTFDKATWRLSLDHHFTDSVMGYVSYNRGFKSGFYEPQTIPALLLLPETLDAYEVGVKSDLFDRRLRFNVAAFYNDYQNVQVTQIYNSRQTVFNGDGATTYGVDFDLTAKPTQALEFDAGVSLLHGTYGAFKQAFLTSINPAGGNFVTLGPLPEGRKLQQTPDATVHLGANYTIPSKAGDFIIGATYYYNSGWYSEPENRLRQPAYSLVDATLTWRVPQKPIEIQIIAKNLTNTVYASQLNASGTGDNRQTAPPRTVAATVRWHFG